MQVSFIYFLYINVLYIKLIAINFKEKEISASKRSIVCKRHLDETNERRAREQGEVKIFKQWNKRSQMNMRTARKTEEERAVLSFRLDERRKPWGTYHSATAISKVDHKLRHWPHCMHRPWSIESS